MAINWKELEKLLSELPLEGSYIQKITEHSVHAFTLHLFEKNEKAWLLYTEISTPHARVCRTEKIRKKAKESQRFTQYLRAHLVGKKVRAVEQLPFDRAFLMTLTGSEETLKVLFRLYSGPGANVIVLDEEDNILELLFRRPQRGEAKGMKLLMDRRSDEGPRHWEVREYEGESFNAYLDRAEDREDKEEKRDEYLALLEERKEKDLKAAEENLRKMMEREEKTRDWEETRHFADLLSASIYLVKKGMGEITLDDWERGTKVTLPLERDRSPNENLEKYYARYHKDKKANELAKEEIQKAKVKLEETEAYYSALLSDDTPLDKLKKALDATREPDKAERLRPGKPGLYLHDQGWDFIIGRNAKENDEILRSETRGSDLWLHTRDYAGGYVIIKAQREKTVPLPVLLDAATLAIHYSKARPNGRADVYYTQVKYLRRVKDGKTGLVLPTQEKNLDARLDEETIRRLLGDED